MFLLVLFLGLPFAESLAFRLSAVLRVAKVSRARCVEIPESCTDGIDKIIEADTIIKEEMRDKQTSWMPYILESDAFLPSEFRQIQRDTHRAKFVRKPTTMRRKAAKRS